MSEAYGDHSSTGLSRSSRLDRILGELVGQVPEIEAASVVSFDGLAMASALPVGMDEDRVAAMSAALLSLGERAAEGLGRGALSQVYIEGENGTVFLISADDEAVLVAVAAKGAKVGLMLFEVRRAAAVVAETLRVELAYETVEETPHPAPLQVVAPPADESDQPADDQPADDQPADDQPADDQPAYDHQHAYDQPAYYAQPLTDELVSDNHTGESAETPSWS